MADRDILASLEPSVYFSDSVICISLILKQVLVMWQTEIFVASPHIFLRCCHIYFFGCVIYISLILQCVFL